MPSPGKYRYGASNSFWKGFYALSSAQKASTRRAWAIFKMDPFDPRLGTHKIHRLSAAQKRIIYAVCIEGDLRAVFTIQDDLVYTLDIGTHAIYLA